VPRAEIEGEIGDTTVGLQARLMSQALRKLAGSLSKSNTTCIFINQLREKIGVMFGNPETTHGRPCPQVLRVGRIDIRRIDYIKQNGEVVGNRVRVKVVKNKVAPPFRRPNSTSCTERASPRRAPSSTWPSTTASSTSPAPGSPMAIERLGQGREAAKEFLRENPDLSGNRPQGTRCLRPRAGRRTCGRACRGRWQEAV
jgi:recombination protein RecA